MKKKILLIGAGGHCKVVLDVLLSSKEYEIAGIVDRKGLVGTMVLGVPVIGSDSDLQTLFKSGIKNAFITVGSVGNPQTRIKLYKIAKEIGFIFPNIAATSALVSSNASLGHGNYIAPGAIIIAGAKLGNHCIVNTGAIIDHDCVIGDFVHLSPGSILSGGVTVGEFSHIGTGSMVIQNLEIGTNVIIGAGSVVTKNINKNTIAYGNPCKERKKDNV
jgi:sugar O-acyltransferase (sialic acid O-acetyltransferase NeuD family)